MLRRTRKVILAATLLALLTGGSMVLPPGRASSAENASSRNQAHRNSVAERPPPVTHVPATERSTAQPSTVEIAEPQTVAQLRQEQQDRVDALRQRRREAGSRPLAEQMAATVNDLRRAGAVDNRQHNAVVLTLEKPMRYDEFREEFGSILESPNTTARPTIYLELSDGYPFTLTGPAEENLPSRLEAQMLNLAESVHQPLPSDAAAAPGAGSVQGSVPIVR